MNTRLKTFLIRHNNSRFRPIEILVNPSRGINLFESDFALTLDNSILLVVGLTCVIAPQHALILGVKTGQLLTAAGTPLYSSCRVLVFYI